MEEILNRGRNRRHTRHTDVNNFYPRPKTLNEHLVCFYRDLSCTIHLNGFRILRWLISIACLSDISVNMPNSDGVGAKVSV